MRSSFEAPFGVVGMSWVGSTLMRGPFSGSSAGYGDWGGMRSRRRRNPRRHRTPRRAHHASRAARGADRADARAAARAGTTAGTVRKYARMALRKRGRTYRAIPVDELPRPMRVLTERGLVVLNIRSNRTASRLGIYSNAVNTYGKTGDRRPLAPFVGKRFRAEGHLMHFITDPRLLDRLIYAGQVSFEDLYEPTA